MTRKTDPAPRFWAKVDMRGEDECWPWRAAVRRSDQGYGAFWLDGRHQPANRVALILSGVDMSDGMEACHRCDNPACCNPKHLFPGTRKTNNDDKVAKGRHVHGERVHTAKLTEEQVAFIRAQRPAGGKLPNGRGQELAKQFGVRVSHVSDILAGRCWR